MPLTALAGPDTAHSGHVQRQAAGAVGLALAAKGVVHIAQGVRQREFRVALQKGRHLALILFRGERTGGIDQLPAGGQHRRRAVQNLRAQLGALLHQRLAVLGDRHGLLAEHSLAGTGGVHQHSVKKLRQSLRNAGRGLVQDDRIGHAHPLQIALEDVGPGSHILIADKQPLPLQRRRQLAALAAGSRAQVQHPHPGLHAQQRGRRRRRGLLRVKHARMVVGVPPGLERFFPHHERRLAERRGFQRHVRFGCKRPRRGAQGRDGHTPGRAVTGGGIERLIPLPQQGPLPGFKIFGGHPTDLLLVFLFFQSRVHKAAPPGHTRGRASGQSASSFLNRKGATNHGKPQQ